MLNDGVFGVNILPKFMYKRLQLPELEGVLFQLKMVYQRGIQPSEIHRNGKIFISGILFKVNFVVLKMSKGEGPYMLLLGRPWSK